MSSPTNKSSKATRKRNNRSFELKLSNYELEDATVIENKLRKVAKENDLTEEEIQQMTQKILRDEHVLALVTLKPEEQIASKAKELEQRTIIITETPSVPKLTRAKVRELNKSTGQILQPVVDASESFETTTLMQAELCSDEDDGEYSIKEDDLVSDDEFSMGVSDIDSNPATPLNNRSLIDESIKYTPDGCFKIPSVNEKEEDLRIATRTRSKFCLEERAIEDLESEFIPPDVDYLDILEHDITANDQEWMQFLNEFSKPLNNSALGEEDDPINDPEYVAAEKEQEDAEELRAVNISKKELADLFAELLEDLGNDGISLENIDLESTIMNNSNFNIDISNQMNQTVESFPAEQANTMYATQETTNNNNTQLVAQQLHPGSYYAGTIDTCLNMPTMSYDGNSSANSVTVRKHIYVDYQENCVYNNNNNEVPAVSVLTKEQYDIFQQQLRIHVQTLTQTYIQTYCHPQLWRIAPQAKEMLLDLNEQAKTNEHLEAHNLKGATTLIDQWEQELSIDNEENKALMEFLHKEITRIAQRRRYKPKFAPRIIEVMLNSPVFIYTDYLPKMPVMPMSTTYHVFSVFENQLIAMGLEKYMQEILQAGIKFPKNAYPLVKACEKMCGELVCGKTKRRIWDHIKTMLKSTEYNAIKYYFEYKCAPPVKLRLLPFNPNNVLTPRERYNQLPIAYRNHLLKISNQEILRYKATANKSKPKIIYEKKPTPNRIIKPAVNPQKNDNSLNCKKKSHRIAKKRTKRLKFHWYINLKKSLRKFKKLRKKRKRQHEKQEVRVISFIRSYWQNIWQEETKYQKVLTFYRPFKALDIFTSLLTELKMFCAETAANEGTSSSTQKRGRGSANAEDKTTNNVVRNKRALRQEENIRHMLLPEAPEEKNRKDAVFAHNFYERVQEVFKTENRTEDFGKFNDLLKSFSPSQDTVSSLYSKMEELFLPQHPELAEIFLSFLLPEQAAEVGKFFEHFMISNATTFITKLNIYFNKQPAQMKKIYNCLSELAEEPNVEMKTVEAKLLPLLKGNQFLIDWFMAQFPKAMPPEKLLPDMEQVNMKEVDKTQDGVYYENMSELMDSPTNEQTTDCQLRYINGRIYTGAKYTLPVKLAFLAEHLIKTRTTATSPATSPATPKSGCVHGLRETEDIPVVNEPIDVETDAQKESTEETAEIKIETTEYEICDENTMRAHALRLNPQYYGNAAVWHNANAGSLSPTKKVRSPGAGSRRLPPMVSIPKSNLAIACAKKLKSLVETDEHEEKSTAANTTSCIVATTKRVMRQDAQLSGKQQSNQKGDISEAKQKKLSQNNASGSSKKSATQQVSAWSRNEDKEMLIEMRVNVEDKPALFERIHKKLPNRTIAEIEERFYFLVHFLSNLQLKKDGNSS